MPRLQTFRPSCRGVLPQNSRLTVVDTVHTEVGQSPYHDPPKINDGATAGVKRVKSLISQVEGKASQTPGYREAVPGRDPGGSKLDHENLLPRPS